MKRIAAILAIVMVLTVAPVVTDASPAEAHSGHYCGHVYHAWTGNGYYYREQFDVHYTLNGRHRHRNRLLYKSKWWHSWSFGYYTYRYC